MSSQKVRNRARRRAEKLMDQAFAAVEADKFHLAVKMSRRAIEQGKVNPRLWLDHGRILARCGEEQEGNEAVRQAIVLAPQYSEAFAELARMQASVGKLVQAVRLQQRAVELAPDEPLFREQLESYLALQPATDGADDVGEGVAEPEFTARTERYEWNEVDAGLEAHGVVRLDGLLSEPECAELIALWDDESRFEFGVDMTDGSDDRGSVAYRFFARPLPPLVQELREELYGRLAAIANDWNERFNRSDRFPGSLADFIARCHDAGQTRTTPILLRYPEGGYNAPHRDIAGKVVFPFQLAVTLGPSTTDTDGGGELRLVDARPGKKVREHRVGTAIGDAVVFCTRERPVRIAGVVGLQPVLHGVTEVANRPRFALGIPFHEHG